MFLNTFLLENIINNPRNRIKTLKRLLEFIGVTLKLSMSEAITIKNEIKANISKGTMNGDFILILLSIWYKIYKAMIGIIDKWITLDNPNKIYFGNPLKYMKEIISIVNEIPDLIPEANKFDTLGVKKIKRNIGNI